MDEPASALDPIATMKIEELIHTCARSDDRDRHSGNSGSRLRLHGFFSTDESRIGR